MRCGEPRHRAVVAIHTSRAGRVAEPACSCGRESRIRESVDHAYPSFGRLLRDAVDY
jgi:hypothetical protein